MATAARRPEFELLRMVGTTRRLVRAMLRWETLTAVVLAAAIGTAAAATLAFASTRAATR